MPRKQSATKGTSVIARVIQDEWLLIHRICANKLFSFCIERCQSWTVRWNVKCTYARAPKSSKVLDVRCSTLTADTSNVGSLFGDFNLRRQPRRQVQNGTKQPFKFHQPMWHFKHISRIIIAKIVLHAKYKWLPLSSGNKNARLVVMITETPQ